MNLKATIITGLFVLFSTPAFAQNFEREYWKGTFTQTSPIPWNGPMELYIRFEAEEAVPQSIEGVLTWSGFGGAKTRIVGERTADGIRFREEECLSGNCGKFVMGGNYLATYSRNRVSLSGKASLKSQGLSGSFTLKKAVLP